MFSKLFGKKKKSVVASKQEDKKDNAKLANKKPVSGARQQNKPQKNKTNKPTNSAKKASYSQKKAVKKPKSNWSIEQFKVEPVEGKTRFHDLGLETDLLHGIADLGFEYCSPIQAASLPHTLLGNDVIGKAQTGTGKTAAFLLTVINDLLKNPIDDERYSGEPRAVVIAPTRELVVQIAKDAAQLVKHTDLNVLTLIGGMNYAKQKQQIDREYVDIVVATPGRLNDCIERRDIHLDQVELLVLDEADRMLDMGFIPQVKRIVRQTPRKEDRQTLLFSATFTDDILRLTEQWTYKPVKVEIEPDSVATDTVDQRVYMLAADEKYRVLKNILSQEQVESVIIFANRRDQTRKLFENLKRDGFACGMLSGEVQQDKRTKTLARFKRGDIKVLVATDVAGRGIHVDGISHVVNYTLPEDADDYVHRIGRTGRAGTKGTSISFACEDDAFLLPNIEALLGDKLNCEQAPEDLLK